MRDGQWTLDTPINERAGAGGVYTNIPDLLKWDENFYSGQVGGTAVLKKLQTQGTLNDGKTLPYAWGLQIGAVPRHADRRAQRIARRLPRAPHSLPVAAHVGRAAVQRERDRADDSRRAASRTSSSATRLPADGAGRGKRKRWRIPDAAAGGDARRDVARGLRRHLRRSPRSTVRLR